MNTFETIVIAVALVFNSWMVYLNAGMSLVGKPFSGKVAYAAAMFVIQFLMAGTGIWIGYKTGSLEVRVNMMISLSILFIFGLKVLLTGIRTQQQEKAFDYSDSRVASFAALAEGVTALAIGIAIGLLSQQPYLHWFLVGIILLVGIIAAIILAGSMGNAALKLRLGPVGGLLMLSAAIKLTLNLSAF